MMNIINRICCPRRNNREATVNQGHVSPQIQVQRNIAEHQHPDETVPLLSQTRQTDTVLTPFPFAGQPRSHSATEIGQIIYDSNYHKVNNTMSKTKSIPVLMTRQQELAQGELVTDQSNALRRSIALGQQLRTGIESRALSYTRIANLGHTPNLGDTIRVLGNIDRGIQDDQHSLNQINETGFPIQERNHMPNQHDQSREEQNDPNEEIFIMDLDLPSPKNNNSH